MDVALRRVVNLQRAQLQGIIELRGVRQMRSLYGSAQADLQQRLRKLVRASRGETFEAHHVRKVLIQVNEGIAQIEAVLAGHLEKTGRLAGVLGQRHLVQSVKALERKFAGVTPVLQVEQAAVVQRVFKGVDPTLLDRYKRSSRLYGKPVVAKIRESLSKSILLNETVDEAVERVAGTGGVLDHQRWRAERIVRTELSHSYGVVKQRSMETIREEMPDLQKRLVATFDNRTGEDSKELNGQTVDVGKPFKWRKPNGQVVEYMQPPNRANDRELVIPWRRSWGTTKGVYDAGPIKPKRVAPNIKPTISRRE